MPNARRDFFAKNPFATAWAHLDHATNQAQNVTFKRHTFKKSDLAGKKILIIGAGVSGLTAAYELASTTSASVTVLEAQSRTGGRCRSLRTGDTLTEDVSSDLYSTPSSTTQIVRFQQPPGDSVPFLNAGPGRIPSTHTLLLGYLKRFAVAVEVYVMNSESNLLQMKDGPVDGSDKPVVSRRVINNTRGWLAEMVYHNARGLLEDLFNRRDVHKTVTKKDVEALHGLMENFGDLDSEGNFVAIGNLPGQDDEEEGGTDRAGYTVLPGVLPGVVSRSLPFENMLESKYWDKCPGIFQSDKILWQPTLMHPTDGMDAVEKSFAREAVAAGATILTNSPVTKIDFDGHYQVTVESMVCGCIHTTTYEADYVMFNAAMPFLEKMTGPGFQASLPENFKTGLDAVYTAQGKENPSERFLAVTTKVGWQANRDLWQRGSDILDPSKFISRGKMDTSALGSNSQVGVVPILGGISWTDHPITQIWYPSVAYHDELGVLTGAYNFNKNAVAFGEMDVESRLCAARIGAARFGKEFSEGLEAGVTVAWQNMPYIKGGWAQWFAVKDGREESAAVFNILQQGADVSGDDVETPTFFIIGDQMSSLPGWQEGAVAAALNAISRMCEPREKLPFLKSLPDPRVMVEGFN